MRSASAVILAMPTVPVRAWIWRLMFDSATLSRSIRVRWPMALRASASTIHEPTPPTPMTQMWAARKRASAASPYSRAMPPKRRSKSMSSPSGAGVLSSSITPFYRTRAGSFFYNRPKHPTEKAPDEQHADGHGARLRPADRHAETLPRQDPQAAGDLAKPAGPPERPRRRCRRPAGRARRAKVLQHGGTPAPRGRGTGPAADARIDGNRRRPGADSYAETTDPGAAPANG